MSFNYHNLISELTIDQFLVLDGNGQFRDLNYGDTINAGEVVLLIDSKDGFQIDSPFLILNPNVTQGNGKTVDAEIGNILAALEEGVDPTALEDFAPAAGGEQGSSLTTSAVILRNGITTLASTSFDTTGTTGTPLSETQELSLLNQFDTTGIEADEPVSILNVAPSGNDVSVTLDEDTSTNGVLTAEDPDPDDVLSFTILSNVQNGTLEVDPDGTWRYTPNEDFSGIDTADILVSDGNGGEDVLTLTLNVTPIPELSLSENDFVDEGSAPEYILTLDKPSTQDTTARITLEYGEAEPEDIESVIARIGENEIPINPDGTITIPAGVTEVTIVVQTAQDTFYESDEDFTVNVEPVFGLVGNPTTLSVIQDGGEIIDDDRPIISIFGDTEVSEGSYANFTVSLSEPAAIETSFRLILNHLNTENDDIEAFEYKNLLGEWVPVPNDGIINLTENIDTVEVRVQTSQNEIYEGAESFNVEVSGVDGILGVDNTLTTILDDGSIPDGDDDRPTVTITGDTEVSEGSYANFTATLSEIADLPVEVQVTLTAIDTEPEDIDAFEYQNSLGEWVTVPSDGLITIPSNTETLELRVLTNQNDIYEGVEHFEVSVSGVDGVLGNDSVTTAIKDGGELNDDDRPTVSIVGGGYIDEGDYANFTASLSQAAETETQIKLTFVPTETEIGDIESFEYQNTLGEWVSVPVDGVITLPANIDTVNIRVKTTHDQLTEQDEAFSINVEGYTGVLGNDSALAIIKDNIPPEALDFDVTVIGGTENIEFEDFVSDTEDDRDLNDIVQVVIESEPEHGVLYYVNEFGERIELSTGDIVPEAGLVQYTVDPDLIDFDAYTEERSFSASDLQNYLDGSSSLTMEGLYTISGGVYSWNEEPFFNEYGRLVYDQAAGEKGFAIDTSHRQNGRDNGDEVGSGEYLAISFDQVEISEATLHLGSINGLFNSDKADLQVYYYKDGELLNVDPITLMVYESVDGHNKEGYAELNYTESFDEVRLVVNNHLNTGSSAGFVLQGVALVSISSLASIDDSFTYSALDTGGLSSEPATVNLTSIDLNVSPTENAIDIVTLENEGLETEQLLWTAVTDNEVLLDNAEIENHEDGIFLDARNESDIIYASNNDDTLYLGESDLIFDGEAMDIAYAGNGDDIVYGEKGVDYIYAGEGDDAVYGGEDNDVLYGENGSDYLNGGEGHDILIGGSGNDYMIGGSGEDIFKFVTEINNETVDRVKDFTSGEDKLDLSEILSEDDGTVEELITLSVVNENDIELTFENNGYEHTIVLENTVSQYGDFIDGTNITDTEGLLNDLLMAEQAILYE